MMPSIAFYHDEYDQKFSTTGLEKIAENPKFRNLIPRLRFFPNMAPHSNDAPYCPLPSCKKLETFNDRFPRKCQKT